MEEKQVVELGEAFVAKGKAGEVTPNGDPQMREVSLRLSDRDYKLKAQQIASWEEQIEDLKADIAETNEELKKQIKDLEAKIKASWLEIRMQAHKKVVKVAEHRDYENGLIYTVRLPEWTLMEVSAMQENEQVSLALPTDKAESGGEAPEEPREEQDEGVQDAEYEEAPESDDDSAEYELI